MLHHNLHSHVKQEHSESPTPPEGPDYTSFKSSRADKQRDDKQLFIFDSCNQNLCELHH